MDNNIYKEVYVQGYRKGQQEAFTAGIRQGKLDMEHKYGKDFIIWCKIKDKLTR